MVADVYSRPSLQVTAPSFGPVKTYELLHHMTGKGLSAKYHFPRQPCLHQAGMVAVQVTLSNGSDRSLEEIHVGDRSPASLNIHCFNTIGEYEASSWCERLYLNKLLPLLEHAPPSP